MSVSFAALSIVSVQNPFTELAGLILGKGDIKVALCLLIFCIVTLFLAYLTNPSETSFRAYLTELSFRQHLSCLDESCEDDSTGPNDGSTRIGPSRGSVSVKGYIRPLDVSPPFYFANRASISVRTPKHVFHSFGVFTIAAMIPLPKSPTHNKPDVSMISDSWYLGAFGKWWRGGVLETWYQDVISRSKDEESWCSGVLSIKSLDMLPEFIDSPKIEIHSRFANVSPPKPRNRERALYKNSIIQPCGVTLHSLSKSALLPLHAVQTPLEPYRRLLVAPSHPSIPNPLQACNATEMSGTSVLPIPRPPPIPLDQSPRIVHVLEQVTTSKTTLADLQIQLHDCQTSTSQTRVSLQEEVGACRERKRIEDTARIETKFRTKALEDSKRAAEFLKREGDKKLKAAQATHNRAYYHTQSLNEETAELHRRLDDDANTLQCCSENATFTERQLTEELEYKKQAIKIAEDIITSLTQRARELESQLDSEKESFYNKKDVVDGRRIKRPQISAPPGDTYLKCIPCVQNDLTAQIDNEPPDSQDLKFMTPCRPRPLLDISPTRSCMPQTEDSSTGALPVPSQYHVGSNPFQIQYSLSDETLGLWDYSASKQILLSHHSIACLDNSDSPSIRSPIQSESDTRLKKDNHDAKTAHSREGYDVQATSTPLFTSQIPVQDLPAQSPQLESFQTSYYPGPHDSGQVNELAEAARDSQSSRWTPPIHMDIGAPRCSHGPLICSPTSIGWLPATSKNMPKRGLNPDAKEFSLPKTPPIHPILKQPSLGSFDSLNHKVLASTVSPTHSTGDSLLRAFAPSPAEREALQRALCGTNTSFERLPSLSDVGNTSPPHDRTSPIAHDPHPTVHPPPWLPAFPRSGKSLFSPWDDEEPVAIDLAQSVTDVLGIIQ